MEDQDPIFSDLSQLCLKERKERERALEGVKERTDNDKKELQISIDKDRDNFSRRLAEEHDQVRKELLVLLKTLPTAAISYLHALPLVWGTE